MSDVLEKNVVDEFIMQLDNKIWITRKCRINAAERLLKAANFVDFMNVYYSVFLILLSLVSVSPYVDNATMISYINLACSITLTISIIYATTLGYKERSAALKQNYIALQELLDRLKLTKEQDEIQKINKEYCDLLRLVENHKHIDYLDLIRTGSVKSCTMTFGNWCYWIACHAWNILFKTVLVILPIVCLVSAFFREK